MAQIKIIHEDKISKVPLGGTDKFATLHERDLDELISLDVDLQWRLVQGTVCTRSGNKYISIARLICDTGLKESVFFVDRDHLNLLRENLIVAPGSGKTRARDELAPSFKFSRSPRAEVVHHVC